HADFVANRIDTDFVEDHLAELVVADDAGLSTNPQGVLREPQHERNTNPFNRGTEVISAHPEEPPSFGGVSKGAKVDSTDPLAVLDYGKRDRAARGVSTLDGDAHDTAGVEHCVVLHAPMQGTNVSIAVHEGDTVQQGEDLL